MTIRSIFFCCCFFTPFFHQFVCFFFYHFVLIEQKDMNAIFIHIIGRFIEQNGFLLFFCVCAVFFLLSNEIDANIMHTSKRERKRNLFFISLYILIYKINRLHTTTLISVLKNINQCSNEIHFN